MIHTIDYEILFDFLSEDDKKLFISWETIEVRNFLENWTMTGNIGNISFKRTIVASFKTQPQPYDDDKIYIGADEYESLLKQKLRDKNLTELLN